MQVAVMQVLNRKEEFDVFLIAPRLLDFSVFIGGVVRFKEMCVAL